MRTFLLWLVLVPVGFSQEPVEGPILDTIEKRITERFEAQSKLLDAIEERINARQEVRLESRFSEVREAIQEARNERKTLLQSFQEWNRERVGLIGRLEAAWQEMQEFKAGFAPFKWIFDRMTGLVWAIGAFVISVVVLFLIIIAIILRMYLWVRNAIVPKDLRT